MATLFLDQRGEQVQGYLLKTTYSEKDAVKAAGGRWDADRRSWKLPLDADLGELENNGVYLCISPEARDYFIREMELYNRLLAYHHCPDAVISNPDGLDPYQRVGVRFLAGARRALLADEMGLGKTAQAIRACTEVCAKCVLVITKKSLLHQWSEEIRKFGPPGVTVGIMSASDTVVPLANYVITNYEAAVRQQDLLMGIPFDVLIVDEAARIKNRKAQRSRAVHALARRIPYLFLLTGTPIHNRPDELWSLLHAIDPVRYSSYWRFVERYCDMVHDGWGWKVLGVRDLDRLQAELAPRMLRRDKSLLNLPPKTYETVQVRLDGIQAKAYRQMREHMIAILGEAKSVMAPTVLAQLTRLRQIVCSPALIGGPDESAKTEALLDLLEDVTPDHKVLIFTTFAEYVKLLLPALEPYNPASLIGEMSDRTRQENIGRFREDPSCRVFVGTVGAMGEGLNLEAADVVVFLNKDWVPAVNAQAEDRAHRRGQEKPVHVVSLAATGTVDEYIEDVLKDKRAVADEVLAVSRIIERIREGT